MQAACKVHYDLTERACKERKNERENAVEADPVVEISSNDLVEEVDDHLASGENEEKVLVAAGH